MSKDYKGLFKGIKEQVQTDRDRIIKAAEREAGQIIQNAEAQVERINNGDEDEDIGGKRRRHRRMIPKKSTSRAQFLLSRWDTKVKHQVLQEMIQGAKKSLAKVRQRKDYPDILARLIKEAVQECDECDTITVHQGDVDQVKKLAKKLNLQQKIVGANNFSGGAIATAYQGKIKVNNTLDARIDQAAPLVVTKIGKILYGSAEN
jgi:vacuolar-type H+-ATPase subunit E/Vma4